MGTISSSGHNPAVTYLGHVFTVSLLGDVAKCDRCALEVSTADAMAGDLALEPCPESDEGRAYAAHKAQEAEKASKLEAPAIAVPESWTGTDAEAVGLAVAGAVGGIARERDLAIQHLGALVSAYPETSWAASSSALDAAKAFLADMGQEAPEGKS